jgi:hypothetical protein
MASIVPRLQFFAGVMVIWCAFPVGGGLVVRIVAAEVEDVFRLLKVALAGLETQAGIRPYADRC